LLPMYLNTGADAEQFPDAQRCQQLLRSKQQQ
jgi:hypothetical protein